MNEPNPLAGRRWLVLASAVVSFFAVGVTFFAVPPMVGELTSRFGLSHLQIGILMGAISVPAIFLSVPLGVAIDRWPARGTGTAGLGLMAVGAVLFAVAPSYLVLLLGRFLFGVGGLVVNLLLARLITTAFAGREIALAMGIFSSVYPASMIVVFSCHTPLSAALGWRGELLGLAVLVGLAIPLHLVAVPREELLELEPSPKARPAASRPLVFLAVSWMLFFVAFAPVLTFAPEWAGGGPAALLTVTAIMWCALVLSPLVGLLIDRLGRPELWACSGHLLLAVALAAMALAVLPPLPCMVLVGLTAAAVPTATYATPGRLVPAHQVAFAFGVITACSNIGTVIGPAVAGLARDTTGGWSVTWLLVAAAPVMGAVSSLMVARRTP